MLLFQEFYEKAFSDTIRAKWQGSGYERQTDQVKNLALMTALAAFYNNDEYAIENRRACLYHFLGKSGYNTTNTDNILNRNIDTLPISTFIPRILNDICNIYDEEPARTFSESDKVNMRMGEIYKQASINSRLQTIYEKAKLTGVVAVTLSIINMMPKLLHITPDKFRVEVNPNDTDSILSMTYVDWSDTDKRYLIHVWTDQEHKIINNATTMTEANRYKRIPFVFMKFGEFFKNTMYETVYKNLLYLNHVFNSHKEATINGMTQWLAVNMPDTIVNRSPDVIHRVVQREGQPEASLTPITGTGLYSDIYDYANKIRTDELSDMGVPIDSLNPEAVSAISGISRLLLHQRLHDIRRKDVNYLLSFENELAELIRVVTNADLYTEQTVGLNMTIKFQEEQIVNEPSVEKEYTKTLLTEGLIDIKEYAIKYGSGFDSSMTNEQIVSIIEERINTMPFKAQEENKSEIINNTMTEIGVDDGVSA